MRASISYVLGANVENLVLAGTAAINGTGNSDNNTLTGNIPRHNVGEARESGVNAKAATARAAKAVRRYCSCRTGVSKLTALHDRAPSDHYCSSCSRQ